MYMEKTSDSKYAPTKRFQPFIDLSELPGDLYISTITTTCRLNTDIFTRNVGKYATLSPGGILACRYGHKPDEQRSIIKLKKRKSPEKKVKKRGTNFYNQVSLVVETKNKKRVNVKLFKNGSIQVTGCRNISHFADALGKVFSELLKEKYVFCPKNKDGEKFFQKKFVTNPDEVSIFKILDIKIRMINSNFHVGFRIDRERLQRILDQANAISTFEPVVHAGVNIKYSYGNKDVISILVFESGAIIITGAKTKDHIEKAYIYITGIIRDNFNDLVKSDMQKLLKTRAAKALLKQADRLYETELADPEIINSKKFKKTQIEYINDHKQYLIQK